MDKSTDLEKKYHIIALEYSKVRSQATVLKKAVIDEQSKNGELKEIIKDLEQKIRKHDQEMESLTFRNEQLAKRISVLQQELQVNSHNKKSKHKQTESVGHPVDFSVLDEELHKKIIENAELVSTMADKDLEIESSRDKIDWLEQKVCQLQKQMYDMEESHNQRLEKLRKETSSISKMQQPAAVDLPVKSAKAVDEKGDSMVRVEDNFWQQEAERWRTECELLKAKPTANEQLTEYYELQVTELLQSKQKAHSEVNSLHAENSALTARIEQLALEKNHLENNILSNVEELSTTSDNYRNQLDAMTEHLAAQNEKITKQCDEIQVLKHRLSLKK